ncbi:hypothetical protein FRB99_007669, partial [Tulasnella sp. 403]
MAPKPGRGRHVLRPSNRFLSIASSRPSRQKDEEGSPEFERSVEQASSMLSGAGYTAMDRSLGSQVTATSVSSQGTSSTAPTSRRPHGASIFVANLPVSTSESSLEEKLRRIFEVHATVLSIKIVRDGTSPSRCAFVQCESQEQAQAAIAACQDCRVDGVLIRCEAAKAHRSLLVSFKADAVGEVECVRFWREVGSRRVFAALNDQAHALPRNVAMRTTRDPLAAPGVVFSFDKGCLQKTVKELAVLFGPVEYVKPFRTHLPMGIFRPHPQPLPPLGSEEGVGDDEGYEGLGPWEIKYEQRGDALSALEALKQVSNLNVTRTHQHHGRGSTVRHQPDEVPHPEMRQGLGIEFPEGGHGEGLESPLTSATPRSGEHSEPPVSATWHSQQRKHPRRLSSHPLSIRTGLAPAMTETDFPRLVSDDVFSRGREPPETRTEHPPTPTPTAPNFEFTRPIVPIKRSVWGLSTTSTTSKLAEVPDPVETPPRAAPATTLGITQGPSESNVSHFPRGTSSTPSRGWRQLDKTCLYIPKLPMSAGWNEYQLRRIFTAYPGLRSVALKPHVGSGRKGKFGLIGYGVVQFDSEDSAKKALEKEDGKTYFGVQLHIEYRKKARWEEALPQTHEPNDPQLLDVAGVLPSSTPPPTTPVAPGEELNVPNDPPLVEKSAVVGDESPAAPQH